jgi:hypothetical protein
MLATTKTLARLMSRRSILALIAFVGIASPLGAQQLRGVVRDSSRAAPLAGAVITALDSAGAPLGRAISDATGRFTLTLPSGVARLRAVRIGYRPRDANVPVYGDTLEIAMSRLPPMLATVRVTDSELCPGVNTSSGALELWEQAKAGLLATVVARDTRPAKVEALTYHRVTTATDERVTEQTTQITSGYSNRPFVAPAEASFFAARGFMQEDASGRLYSAPDADVLLDDAFAVTHCFHVQAADRDHVDQIGLAFSPARGRDRLVDVAGVVWMDRVSPRIRSLDFRYTGLEPAAERVGSGGHIEFRSMETGVAFVERWHLRLATLVVDGKQRVDFAPGLSRDRRGRNEFRVAELRESGGSVLTAVWPDGAVWSDSLAGLTGSVVQRRSSLSIPAAVVALSGTNQRTLTAADGSFELVPVVPGRYTFTVTDTTLAEYAAPRSSRLDAEVVRGRLTTIRAELTPLADVIREVCRDQTVPRGTSMVVGRASVLGAERPTGQVIARWQATYNNGSPVTAENSTGRTLAINGAEQRVDIDEKGRFVVCGVARGRPIHLRYVQGDRFADTTFFVGDSLLYPVDWRVSLPAVKSGGSDSAGQIRPGPPRRMGSAWQACCLPRFEGDDLERRRAAPMTERRKTHNGRDVDGRFRVRQADVDDLLEDPSGPDVVQDDVRLGGAVADTGPAAGSHARQIGDLIDENRQDVGRVTGRSGGQGRGKRRR